MTECGLACSPAEFWKGCWESVGAGDADCSCGAHIWESALCACIPPARPPHSIQPLGLRACPGASLSLSPSTLSLALLPTAFSKERLFSSVLRLACSHTHWPIRPILQVHLRPFPITPAIFTTENKNARSFFIRGVQWIEINWLGSSSKSVNLKHCFMLCSFLAANIC